MSEDNSNREEFIIFRVGEHEFCVEMSSTREIRGWTPATPLPNSAEYLLGIINLRGNILPIIDLGTRLGLGASEQSERHVIIVVRLRDKEFGLLVDAVSDIISAGPDDLRPVPELNSNLTEDFFRQVIVLDDRIICDLVLDRLLPELESLAA